MDFRSYERKTRRVLILNDLPITVKCGIHWHTWWKRANMDYFKLLPGLNIICLCNRDHALKIATHGFSVVSHDSNVILRRTGSETDTKDTLVAHRRYSFPNFPGFNLQTLCAASIANALQEIPSPDLFVAPDGKIMLPNSLASKYFGKTYLHSFKGDRKALSSPWLTQPFGKLEPEQ